MDPLQPFKVRQSRYIFILDSGDDVYSYSSYDKDTYHDNILPGSSEETIPYQTDDIFHSNNAISSHNLLQKHAPKRNHTALDNSHAAGNEN